MLATVDGQTARKHALAQRLSHVASDELWWATVARLRCFRGVDTLAALSTHLDLGADWQRCERAHRVGAWLGLTPALTSSASPPDRERSQTPSSGLARRLLIEAAWH